MIKLNEYMSLSEGKTIFGRFSIDGTKSLEGIKIQHQKQDCLYCINQLMCGESVVKRIMNCFNCEMKRACNSCINI